MSISGLAGQPTTSTSFVGVTMCGGPTHFTLPPKQTNESFWKAIYILINEEAGGVIYTARPFNSEEYVIFASVGMGFYQCGVSNSARRMLSSDLRTIDLKISAIDFYALLRILQGTFPKTINYFDGPPIESYRLWEYIGLVEMHHGSYSSKLQLTDLCKQLIAENLVELAKLIWDSDTNIKFVVSLIGKGSWGSVLPQLPLDMASSISKIIKEC